MLILFLYVLAIFGIYTCTEAAEYTRNTSDFVVMADGVACLIMAHTLIRTMLRTYSNVVIQRFLLGFLASFVICLIYFKLDYLPYLESHYGFEYFDPVRYYAAADEILRFGHTNASFNYYGIVYFYATAMKLFGMHPLVPLFVNQLLLLFAVLVFTKFTKNICQLDLSKYTPLLFFVPELIGFNAMSSREIVCTACFAVAILKSVELVQKFSYPTLTIMLVAVILIFAVRPPYGMLTMICMALPLLFKVKSKGLQVVYLVAALGIVVAANQLSSALGDNTELTEQRMENTESFEESSIANYSENSFSRALIPHNTFEFVVFGAIRTIGYVLLTPGQVTSGFYENFIKSSSESVTIVFTSWSTLFIMLLLPLYWKGRKLLKRDVNLRILYFSVLIAFYIVATFSTEFVHLRYRLVATLLYFATALYIYVATRRRHRA